MKFKLFLYVAMMVLIFCAVLFVMFRKMFEPVLAVPGGAQILVITILIIIALLIVAFKSGIDF